ncbi:hypothetical protein CHARACLAT_018266 [Characodon lateralis]|uniref:Fibronectin type-III domain-containing protein n=1 Tax=Characodon lateralis TaxID=208331 RepID=A0ABU7D251_9TELE|nr:hypothetical protein [Characodon lateralis]
MLSVKVLLYIGAFVTAWSITTDGHFVPTAKNVRWVSLDFQTILTWTVEESEHTYSVLYSAGTTKSIHGIWELHDRLTGPCSEKFSNLLDQTEGRRSADAVTDFKGSFCR